MKQNTKKIMIGILATGLLTALGIGGTLAYMTDSEQVTNHFSMGDLDITIDEPSWFDGDPTETTEPGETTDPTAPTSPPGDGQDLIPGDTRDKDPTITAVEGDSYMRVVMMLQDQDDTIITDEARVDLILTTLRYAQDGAIKEGTSYSLADIAKIPTVNDAFTLDAAHSSAGIYYYNYNSIFKKDDTAVLFTNVVIPTDWDYPELEKLGQYKVVLQAQAIQSANFADAAAAFAALDSAINTNPDTAVDKNYGVVDEDSDKQFVLVGKTVIS